MDSTAKNTSRCHRPFDQVPTQTTSRAWLSCQIEHFQTFFATSNNQLKQNLPEKKTLWNLFIDTLTIGKKLT